MVGERAPNMISGLFGVHRNTATQWAAPARNSCADHLAALSAIE
ncbi:hypothetical protein OHB53_45595 [Streptomyces sp. NBC_00056]|nr:MULTISPECIES: hypothetical protein [unclassified Streptomyces]MCX5443399.1 hypothetical protein [Streptomyces sp. NBC_00063]WUB98804.1 hypothetical protein OHO83_44455 [Streptomyces sp. NBC_00569]